MTKVTTGGSMSTVFFVGILLFSILSYTPGLKSIGYGLTISAYICFLFSSVKKHSARLVATRTIFISLLVIFFLYLLHAIWSPFGPTLQASSIVRAPLFIGIALVNICYIPHVISKEAFFRTVRGLSVILVIVGLPTIFIGSYELLGIVIKPWHIDLQISLPFVGDIELPRLTSVFRRTNSFSRFLLGGVLSSLVILDEERDIPSFILFAIIALGLLLAYSRATIFSMLIGAICYLIYRSFGVRWLRYLTILGSLAVTVLVLMLTGFIPEPRHIQVIDFTGRRVLWEATIDAIKVNPLVGFGPGDTANQITEYVPAEYVGRNPHNSYLRMFLTTGIIGGSAYLALFFFSIFPALRLQNERFPAGVFAINIGFIINQLFSAFSVFGISASSIPAAIALGYLVTTLCQQED